MKKRLSSNGITERLFYSAVIILSFIMVTACGSEEKKAQSSNQMITTQSIVRDGVIDVESIDKNGDGKVFQDMMDFNVISDSSGKCPICGMELKEVTLDRAKENLHNHEFKTK